MLQFLINFFLSISWISAFLKAKSGFSKYEIYGKYLIVWKKYIDSLYVITLNTVNLPDLIPVYVYHPLLEYRLSLKIEFFIKLPSFLGKGSKTPGTETFRKGGGTPLSVNFFQ